MYCKFLPPIYYSSYMFNAHVSTSCICTKLQCIGLTLYSLWQLLKCHCKHDKNILENHLNKHDFTSFVSNMFVFVVYIHVRIFKCVFTTKCYLFFVNLAIPMHSCMMHWLVWQSRGRADNRLVYSLLQPTTTNVWVFIQAAASAIQSPSTE